MKYNWYVFFCRSGREDKVKERIEYRLKDLECEYRIIVPKRRLRERKEGKWHDRLRVLFPGYVFVRGEMNIDVYYLTKRIPDLVKILKDEKEPVPLYKEEAEFFEHLLIDDEIVEFSEILFESGVVRVISGPLTAMEGQIVSINKRKGRAKVNLTFLGEDRTIELGIKFLEPA